MSRVFVITSHVEVEKHNWSSEVVKVFAKREDAEAFAQALEKQAEANETIEIQELPLE